MIYEPFVRHWMTIHSLLVMLGLAVYVIATHVLRQRRHPSAAIAWVAALVFLPYLALPLYLMFGSRKLTSYRPEVGKFSSTTNTSSPDSLVTRTQQLCAVMKLPVASGYHHLNIHEDGGQALQALKNLIEEAKNTIDLCTFIFSGDRLGKDIANILKRRALEGVRVRLLVDGIGAYLGGHADFKSLSAAGVQVVLFVPPLRSSLRGRSNLRNHRKMVIADGEWLWCGGRNLALQYFASDATSASEKPAWIDLSFDLQGPLARQAQQRFELDWHFASRGTLLEPAQPFSQPSQPASGVAQLIASGPDQMDDTLYTILVSGCFSSRKRILVVTPYFVPDQALLMSLTLAARRGVSVEILMPQTSNHLLADLARHRALRELTLAGGRIWFLPNMIHAKAVVIDDEIALAGSANLDERSLFLNFELMVAFYEPTDVKRFAQWIEQQRNTAVIYQFHPPGFLREIAEGLFLWLAFQL